MALTTGNIAQNYSLTGLDRKVEEGTDSWPLKIMLERMPVIYWTVDKDLTLTSLHGHGLVAMGVTPGQMVGQKINEFFQTKDFNASPIWMHRRTLMGYASTFEHEWKGKVYQVYLEAQRDRLGRIIGCFGMGVEVTPHTLTRSAPPREIEEMSVMYRAAVLATEAATEDELIESMTRLVGERLYPHHFGVILLDETSGGLSHHASFRRDQSHTNGIFPLGTLLAGRVANENKLIRINDTIQEHSPTGIYPGMRSAVCVPIRLGEYVIGVLEAESPYPNAYNEADERLLTTFAGLLANAIEKTRLFESTRRRNAELEALREAGLRLTSNLELQPVLDAILANALQLVSADRAHIFINNDHQPIFAASLNRENQNPAVLSTESLRAFALQVAEQRTPQVVVDGRKTSPLQEQGWKGAAAGFPLMIGERTMGVMVILYDTPHRIDTAEMRVLSLLADQAAIALENARLYRDMEEGYLETVVALAKAMDARDSYTADHSQRLAEWAEKTAHELGCTRQQIQAIRWGALLHDIGKIGIPDRILRKPAPLDEQEWDLMRQHPTIGAEIIRPVRRLADVVPIVLSHQERWDGKGYPNHLTGESIPLGGRILAVVDAFGAITDDRVYRKARTAAEALVELKKCSGSHFDPSVVNAFLKVIKNHNGQNQQRNQPAME